MQTSRTPANPDREFYTCSNKTYSRIARAHVGGCNFFKWADAVRVPPLPVDDDDDSDDSDYAPSGAIDLGEESFEEDELGDSEYEDDGFTDFDDRPAKKAKTDIMPEMPAHVARVFYISLTDQDKNCPVCLEATTDETFRLLACGHCYCGTCVGIVRTKFKKCSVCRQP